MMHMVKCVVWALTAVGSMHLGLVGLGSGLFKLLPFLQPLWLPVHYVLGAAGVASMVMLVQHWMSGCASCGCK